MEAFWLSAQLTWFYPMDKIQSCEAWVRQMECI